ncbi:hypothetical protein [Pseudobacteriovorax antillogorgiicola]|uniref:Uncharacterized protein n=1 Tax=Pseudobacteriovorax antillogorgiicola TaxID=1513793 RepID=A0A1Y6C242_9BACT|nr:hypothetical protein [Pseudobacteriovorax antillogorgiicola]TCS50228.1 hypothetical protein EDD56_11346 [Pseudobacteriovorax antillogorgiicola]SMF32653.1 hypothetical protein SAMN06296036_11045 [Pseudobacteriovorax antillogorgiicola]
MEKLSKFLEFGCIDHRLYWRIPDRQARELYEVQWRKDHPTPWRYRRLGDIFWKLCKGEQIAEALEKEGVDVLALETKVRYSVLQQVAFADKIVDDARKQFGKETVDQAIEENQQFMAQLEAAVMRLTTQGQKNQNPKRPRLQLIKN